MVENIVFVILCDKKDSLNELPFCHIQLHSPKIAKIIFFSPPIHFRSNSQ